VAANEVATPILIVQDQNVFDDLSRVLFAVD
jgi:hypothetical protein